MQTLTELAGETPETVLVRRIGEPVQVDHEALSLLTVARLLPGERVRVHRADGRVVAVREGAAESTGVSLPTRWPSTCSPPWSEAQPPCRAGCVPLARHARNGVLPACLVRPPRATARERHGALCAV